MADLSPVTIPAGAPVDDDVTVKVRGAAIGGWTRVTVTASIESVPRVFQVGMTAFPGVVAQAGDPCEVYIGKSKVISGFIDRDTEGGEAASHQLELVGRGKCCDLVDCSAEWEGGQITGANAQEIATKLAQPYGIHVYTAPGTALGPKIPQFNLTIGETAYGIIERLTRFAKQLAYEDEDGNLVLAQGGKTKAASGVVYGQNVLHWDVTNSLDQRYAKYTLSALSIDLSGDYAPSGSSFIFTAPDTDPALRKRTLYLVADTALNDYEIPKARTEWELNRRAGRSVAVRVTVDSWRDSGGTLWTPNTLVPVDVPGLRLADKTLLLAEVTYSYDDAGGKIADLLLMPPKAFAIEPILLQPGVPDAQPSP